MLPSAESVAKGYEQQRVALAVIVLKRSRSRLLEIDQRRTRRSPPQSAGFTNQGARDGGPRRLQVCCFWCPGERGVSRRFVAAGATKQPRALASTRDPVTPEAAAPLPLPPRFAMRHAPPSFDVPLGRLGLPALRLAVGLSRNAVPGADVDAGRWLGYPCLATSRPGVGSRARPARSYWRGSAVEGSRLLVRRGFWRFGARRSEETVVLRGAS